MRYTEQKERSAELLRAALGHMGKHDAALNPITFTIWYEYAAGFNSKLTAAVVECLKTEPRIGDDTVARLYRECVSEVDGATMERLSGDFQRLITGIAESASRTGDQAGVFDAQLNGLSEALQSQDISGLSPRLNEALQGTADMKSSAQALQQQVQSSHSEIERLRSDLLREREEALIDALTRVLNRKGFDLKLLSLVGQPMPAGTAHCLVLLDIDHFKKVNDTHGHLMGDKVLQALGEVLRASVTTGTHSVARYGGEEFAILLPNTSVDEGVRMAELVRARIKAMKLRNRATGEVLLTITASAGVASLRVGDDPQSLIARADEALYRSKQSGRDRVTRAPD